MGSPIDRILQLLETPKKQGDGWVARCPAHDDKRASLSIGQGRDGVVLHCHAGCETETIVARLGLKMADLFESKPAAGRQGLGEVVDRYDYTDDHGNIVFQVIRYEPKNFRQRRPARPDDAPDKIRDGWVWSVSGVQAIPFRLPRVRAAAKAKKPILVVEGEKDVLALERLNPAITATCNAGGAGKWRDEHSRALLGAQAVYLIPDNDEPGGKHMAQVAESLTRVGQPNVRVMRLAGLPPKGDVSDWIAAGGTFDALEDLASAPATPALAEAPDADQWEEAPKDEEAPARHFCSTIGPFLDEVDAPVKYLVNELVPEAVTMLIHGEPRSRKSWIGLELWLAIGTGTAAFGMDRFRVPQPAPVIYASQEDSRDAVRRRMRRLLKHRGVDHHDPQLAERLLHAVHAGIDLDRAEDQSLLLDEVKRLQARALIIDPARRFSRNVDKGPDEVQAITAFFRRVVNETRCATLVIHHDVKPARNQDDNRRTGHRASGGDWFAASDCLIYVQKNGEQSVALPEDYKFGIDPQNFTFRVVGGQDDERVAVLGTDAGGIELSHIGFDNKLTEFLRGCGAPRTLSQVCHGVGRSRADVADALERLLKAGVVDSCEIQSRGSKGGIAQGWFLKRSSEAAA